MFVGDAAEVQNGKLSNVLMVLSSDKGIVMSLLYSLVHISWTVQNFNSEHVSRVHKY
jgi:hypothetical protein